MSDQPTPGEWRVKEITRKHSWDYAIESVAEDGAIWSVAKAIGVGERHGEAEANARLIAAAPEMLEELRKITTYLKHKVGEWSKEDFKNLNFTSTLDVIDKAEGRE